MLLGCFLLLFIIFFFGKFFSHHEGIKMSPPRTCRTGQKDSPCLSLSMPWIVYVLLHAGCHTPWPARPGVCICLLTAHQCPQKRQDVPRCACPVPSLPLQQVTLLADGHSVSQGTGSLRSCTQQQGLVQTQDWADLIVPNSASELTSGIRQ